MFVDWEERDATGFASNYEGMDEAAGLAGVERNLEVRKKERKKFR